MTTKGQLSLEFIIVIVMAFMTVFTFLFVMTSISNQKVTEKAYLELNDLGISLQQEFVFAAQLEDGYIRTFYIPDKINALEYNLQIGNASNTYGFMTITFENQEIFYRIPLVQGTITKGDNQLRKINGELFLN